MQTMIAISGATGALGSALYMELATKDIALRLLVRNKSKITNFIKKDNLKNTQIVEYNGYHDKEDCIRALKGCEVCYMVSGKEEPDRLQQHYTFIDALVEAGVKHVVYTSFKGAAPDATFLLARDHYNTEQYIRSKDQLSHTFLRNALYQDTLLSFVSEDGKIRGPAGKGVICPIARQDIALFSAKTLENVKLHQNKTYTLTGPEDFNLSEIAKIIGTMRARSIEFIDETDQEARESRSEINAPEWLLNAWISTYTAMKSGEMGGANNTYFDIMRKQPMHFRDFVAASWAKASSSE